MRKLRTNLLYVDHWPFSPFSTKVLISRLQFWGQQLATLLDTGLFISVDAEPFHPTYFSHSNGGAYPHDNSNPILPLFLYFAWLLPTSDSFFQAAIRESARVILQQAINEGQDVGGAKQIIYSNYAVQDETLPRMFGGNVARLQSIKQTYDPQNVMNLAGGFKF